MATKNLRDKPIRQVPRAATAVLEGQSFAREWLIWLRDLYEAIFNLQQLSPFVVVRSVTADYTAEPGEQVLCDPTGGAFTVSLPATTQGLRSREHMQVDVKHDSDSTNGVTVSATDIDGAATFVLAAREDITCIRVPGADRWVIR